jgi:hypothetical protein
MGTAEKTLAILLRLNAVLLLAAMFPMVMPLEWMDATHRWLGMGELPAGPIVGYLARSVSLLYAVHGALLLYVSLDVRRFLPVVRCLALLDIALGLGLLAVDWTMEMPLYWIIGEGPLIAAMGAIFLWLVARTERDIAKSTGIPTHCSMPFMRPNKRVKQNKES